MLSLDLYNFESVDAEDCHYILTSPRSLEACTRLAVKPMELLHKPLNEYIEDDQGVSSIRHLQNLYECREKQRLDLLRKCRQVREKIILEEKARLGRSSTRQLSNDSYDKSFCTGERLSEDETLGTGEKLSTDKMLCTREKLTMGEKLSVDEMLSGDEPAKRPRDHVVMAWEEDEKKRRIRERKFQEKLAMRNELVHKERLKQKRIKASQAFIKREEKAHLQNTLKAIEEQTLRSQSMIEEQEKMRRHQLLLKLEEQRHRKKKQEMALQHYEEEIEGYQCAVEKHQQRRLGRAEEQRLKELKSKQTEVKEKNRKKRVCHQSRKKCIDEQISEEQKVLEENIQLKQINMDRLYRNQSWQKTQHMLENKQKEAKRKLKNQQTQKQYQDDLEDWQNELKDYVNRGQARASVKTNWTAEQKALRAHEKRVAREKMHQTLMKRVQEDDDLYREYLWHQISAKDSRSKVFSEQREETKQILRNAARKSSASQEPTKSKSNRSFDKMVKEAELKASLSAGPQQARKNRSSLWLT